MATNDFDVTWPAPQVATWLAAEFPELAPKFTNKNGKHLAKYSKEDLIAICGEADGRALYNEIHTNAALSPDLGAVAKYLHNIGLLLQSTSNDLENSFLSVDTWQEDNTVIGKVMPFVDRVHEIDRLKRVLYCLYSWWTKVHNLPPSKWEESYKEKGFSFIICGAASGIGKSTFARTAFVEILRLFEGLITKGQQSVDPLIQLLRTCVGQHSLYRTTFVHMQAWEQSNPACSIAFRLLHAACKHFFVDKQLQSYPHFATSYPPPFMLTLEHVFKFVRLFLKIPASQSLMMVYHLDELNHLQLEKAHQQYMHDVLAHMHISMIQQNIFLVPMLTGTNAEDLNRLKISSGFPISSINLGPLALRYLRNIFVIVVKRLADHVHKPVPSVIANYPKDKYSTEFEFRELEILLTDCGGNPQVCVILIGVLAGTKNFLQKAFGISDSQLVKLLKEIDELTAVTTKTIRDTMWHAVVTSHVLGSLEVTTELAEVIFGFGLTGDLVQRSTKLLKDVTVGYAESCGALYLLQVEGDYDPLAQRFRVMLPNLHYRTLQFKNDCPPLTLLKDWTTNPRNNELHDIEYLAFRAWWLKKTTTTQSFKLSELLPSLKFTPKRDIQLLFPPNFNVTELGIETKNKFKHQILQCRTEWEGMHFFLGPGKESFVDSWAVFYLASAPSTPFTLMIQSRQTITERESKDCAEQLKACEEAVPAPLQFHLLVISDGTIEAHDSDKLHCVEGAQLESFFGPVLGPLRNSTIELLRGVVDDHELVLPEPMDSN